MLVAIGAAAATAIMGVQFTTWSYQVEARLNERVGEHQRLTVSKNMLDAQQNATDETVPANLMWQASREGQATAVVQAKVAQVAEDVGLFLRAVSPTESSLFDTVNEIAVRVEFAADLSLAVSYLQLLEENTPPLILERVQMRKALSSQFSEQPTVLVQLNLVAPVSYSTSVGQ